MEEMREVAEAYFNVASKEMKQMAINFFNSMDDNNDNLISRPEFVAFMRQKGYSRMNNPDIFKQLNSDKSGNLNFWDVMTLYYIIKSGRPFCDGCAVLILNGMYFTCVECFHTKDDTFNLCFRCFRSQNFVHGHKNLLDNYVLLEATRKKALAEAEAEATRKKALAEAEAEATKDKKKESKRQRFANKFKRSRATDATTVTQPSTASASEAIVPASNIGPMHAAFKALELAVGIGAIASNTMQCIIL